MADEKKGDEWTKCYLVLALVPNKGHLNKPEKEGVDFQYRTCTGLAL